MEVSLFLTEWTTLRARFSIAVLVVHHGGDSVLKVMKSAHKQPWIQHQCNDDDDVELGCQDDRFNVALCPHKPTGSLGQGAQDGHLDFHTAPELWICATSVQQ